MEKVNNALNKVALIITNMVSTMWCAIIFCLIALYGLPAALKPSGEGLVSWVAQTFLQLVLLSIIMVGQKLQADATITHISKKHDELKQHITATHKSSYTTPPQGESSK